MSVYENCSCKLLYKGARRQTKRRNTCCRSSNTQDSVVITLKRTRLQHRYCISRCNRSFNSIGRSNLWYTRISSQYWLLVFDLDWNTIRSWIVNVSLSILDGTKRIMQTLQGLSSIYFRALSLSYLSSWVILVSWDISTCFHEQSSATIIATWYGPNWGWETTRS